MACFFFPPSKLDVRFASPCTNLRVLETLQMIMLWGKRTLQLTEEHTAGPSAGSRAAGAAQPLYQQQVAQTVTGGICNSLCPHR